MLYGSSNQGVCIHYKQGRSPPRDAGFPELIKRECFKLFL